MTVDPWGHVPLVDRDDDPPPDALHCPMRACDNLSAFNGRLYRGRRMCAQHTADFDQYDGSL